jgi:hypothetical protein
MKYTRPNFNKEWMEALRYPEFEKMGKDGWLKVANENYEITNFEKIKDVLNNVDLDYKSLDNDKIKRFERAFEKGVIEIPIVVRFSENDYDLLGGNTRLAGLIDKGINPKLWVVYLTKKEDMTEKWSKEYKDRIDCNNPKGFSQKAHCQGKKIETKEMTGADSAGSFESGLNTNIIKKPIKKVHNLKTTDVDEQTVADSSGSYDVPFGGGTKGRKSPLKIDGVKSIKNSRAVKDKNFPKYGGPKGVYVKIKDKCKKFPYCNQGDINALELLETTDLKNIMTTISNNYDIPFNSVKKLIINEINNIFI